MADASREAWITGVGLVSCLGEGADAHWQKLDAATPVYDTETFAPYVVHPLAPLTLDSQIPKKGDQRQMEQWQRTGTYAAGLALDSAGLKGKAEILGRTDMIVAAGGGERDYAVDSAIVSGLGTAENPGAYLNERLTNDLRPTLFLAQLSNLLAGNISIVHGVTGSSRTFMGEEGSGIEAVRIGQARIAAGQSDVALVGGSQNGERKDLLMLFEFGGYALKAPYRPVWDRAGQPGFATASLGAFLVIEARSHAEARGAKPLARLSAVVSDRAARTEAGAVQASLERLWSRLPAVATDRAAVLSGATGAAGATEEERALLAARGLPVRATGSVAGHSIEPQFVFNIALATLALGQGRLFAPCDTTGFETPATGALDQVVVTGVGHWRGEGLALVETVR
ncbi:beta-ketoacyl-ACP synthase [Rhodoplanes roseus]|uniref:Beta-ketoacyl-ACP synthase II n=1 Tax=Rhodoplanes roseus TaxID=29409 RepID=A0A327KCP0_9BRAD|nr:beta-ketoacyl-ACP synthase [Rhodoplanes roseus]RAI36559.1 beta-ketoacyl-ACP synthase II [Rhodoplanes roseus]